MPAMLSRAFVFILCLVVFCSARAQAQTDGSLPTHIKDPIFLQIPPAPTYIEDKNSLTLSLSYDYERCQAFYGDNYFKGCYRRLGLDGRKPDAGVSISPAIEGEWRWQGDYALTFTPSQNWRAGENYTISLDLEALQVPGNVLLGQGVRQAVITMQTSPLRVDFPEMNYMQDPSDPARKLVSARLAMNYPVDPKKLEAKIRLEMEEESGGKLALSDAELTYDIQHDAGSMAAWVSMPVKTLPDHDRYLSLIIDPGLEPLHGGLTSATAFTERARIPTLTSYLTVSDAAAAIIRSEDGTPQQIVSLQTNVQALPANVHEKIKVYLLPAQHPVMKRAKSSTGQPEIYDWKGTNEVTPEILKQAEPLTLQSMKDSDSYMTQFGFPVSAPAKRYLYMVVDKGMTAFGNYTLDRPFEALLQVPDWPADIQVMQEGSILTLSGAKKISLHARGTDNLQIEVAHIRTEALQHFISQTEGDISSPSFRNWSFDKEDIARIDTKDVPMNYRTPQESQYTALDFSPYLKDGRKGLFLLSIQGSKDKAVLGYAQQRFVLVTDMGLLIKQGGDGSRDVYLVSFTDGKPVSGAEISVLGRNGISIFDAKTDADGHVTLPDLSASVRDSEPVAVVAQKNGDYTFIPYDRQDRVLNLSQFEVGGDMTAAEGMNAFLFSDRGIYRPGETIHLGALVRNADWTPLPPGLPLQMVITDPRGRTVHDSVLEFPAQGLQEVSLDTEESWPTGTYYARLHIANDGYAGSLLGNVSFRVEEFQPDRLKMSAEFSSESAGWIKPEDLKSTITLTNLYGTPATGRRVTASVTLNPAILSFDRYEKYRFYDSHAAKARTIHYDLPDAQTDANGKATLPLNIDLQEPATYSLNLETRGYEAGSGRGVTTYSTAMVSPMDYAVGYKTDANTGYLKKGSTYSVDILAVNLDLQPVAVDDLSLELISRTFVSTLVKREDGSYTYESVPREETVKTETFAIAEAGAKLNLPTETIGAFSWRLKNNKGFVVADIPFSIAGEGQRAAGADREAVLDIRINKEKYEPGENIEISMTAPYAGAGLITLESDKVIAHKWFRTDKTDTIQTIAVPKEFSGKGYVNVAFVRDINSKEIYLKPLSYAVVPFIANTDARTSKIELDIPAVVRPGEAVTVKYRGNTKGKAIIYAVDEGILQIARYETPDPVHFFLLNRALQVRTLQMLDLLMPEYDLVRQLSAAGGDAEAEAAVLGKHLNPFKRKTLAPAVFWTGIVDLDTAENTVTFTPPGHFNGQMRVMAVAVSDAGIGSAEKDMNVRGDIILTPNFPLFMTPGDEAEVSVTVANNIEGSGADAKISIFDLGHPSLPAKTSVRQTVIIPEGSEKTLNFTVKATDVGPSGFSIRAEYNQIRQEALATLSIRPPVPLETTLIAGYAEKGKAEIKLTRSLHEELGGRQIALSPLPTSYIYGLLRYLDEFPYGCTEQLVSKAFPQMSLYSQPEFGIDAETMKKKVWDTVSTLRQRQTPDGGFSLWDGGYDAHGFLSVYAMDFLIRAQEESLPVPGEMVEMGLQYLRNWTNESITSMEDARQKAYGIYVLTRSGIVTTNEILHLLQYYEDGKKEWKTDLAAAYIAAAYKMMQQSALAEQTISDFEKGAFATQMSYKIDVWESEWYNPFIKYAQYISLLARHFPEHMGNLDKNIVFNLAAFIQENHYSTISSSYAIQALQDYARREKDAFDPEKLEVKIDGKKTPVSEAVFTIPLTAQTLWFDADKKPIFYTITETGFDRTLPAAPVAQNIEIERKYQTVDGALLPDTVELGTVVESIITVRSHGDRYISNVAIVDLLPGGFELDMENATAGAMDFVDKREDRVIAFGSVSPSGQTFRYRMRATAKGTFIVPPAFAEAMYDPTTKTRGIAGEITVTDPQ